MPDPDIPEDFPNLTVLRELGDEDLVRLLVRGQAEAMTVIFDRYYAIMMGVALRIVRNRAEADDVVQVAFVDFYRQVQTFDARKGSLRAWLVQYVYGRCINRLKRLRRRHHFDHVELSQVPPSELATPDERIFDLNGQEVRRLVQEVLGTLSEKKRRTVELVCLGGMSITEVAAMTGEPHGRLQHRYYRAIAKLRAWAKQTEKERPRAAQQETVSEKVGRKLPNAAKVSTEEVEIG
jgi:RNA polymerase sigma-70 factor, ECF subfamily